MLGALCLRLGMLKGRQLADASRLTRRLDVLPDAPANGAVVLDTSALMERATLVLGRSGMLGPEVLVPEPVVDEVRTLAAGPDPVSARRARRGLEAIPALREAGVSVTVVPADVPAAFSTEEKVLAIAGRLGARLVTCSADVAMRHEELGVTVLDLRALVADVAPDHVPGEHLEVDLLRAGRQQGQAIGYLPDGDMVVVNDAEHLVGRNGIPVVVLSTRPTAQGLLVFARLAEGSSAPVS